MEADKRMGSRHWKLVAIMIVLLGCSCLYVWFYNVDGPTPQKGQEQAAELMAALEEYKQQEGTYPADLSELKPDYLSTLPQPSWRTQFEYKTFESGAEYTIHFQKGNNADDWCGFGSWTKEWQCADSVPPFWWGP